ncbi:unnamed protein product [Parajaminaea phylloscopi]
MSHLAHDYWDSEYHQLRDELLTELSTIHQSLESVHLHLDAMESARSNAVQRVFAGQNDPQQSGAITSHLQGARQVTRYSKTGYHPGLPDEIIAAIFQQLFRGREPENFPPAVLHVCRQWRQVAMSTKSLWTDTSIFAFPGRFTRRNPEWDIVRPSARPAVHRRLLEDHRILQFCDERTDHALQKIRLRLEQSGAVEDALRLALYSGPTLRDLDLSFGPVTQRRHNEATLHDEENSARRGLVYRLICSAPHLAALKLKIPAPVCGQAIECFHITRALPPGQNLKSLTLLDTDYVDLHLQNPTWRIGSGIIAYFWSSLAMGLRMCNIATLTDARMVRTILSEVHGTVEVLQVNSDLFSTFAMAAPSPPMVFGRLKRLCLFGTTHEELHNINCAEFLPCLEEIEGSFHAVSWALHAGLSSMTLWIDEGEMPTRAVEIWTTIPQLTYLRHLTIIAAADLVLALMQGFALAWWESAQEAARFEGDCPVSKPASPSLEVISLIVERRCHLVAEYFSPVVESEDSLEADHESQLRIKEAAIKAVREYKRRSEALQRASGLSDTENSMQEAKTIKRLTIRNFWYSQMMLWDIRASYSEKMTQASVPTTIAPEGASPYPESQEGCIFDIVPEVPENFDPAEWKALVAESLKTGLRW